MNGSGRAGAVRARNAAMASLGHAVLLVAVVVGGCSSGSFNVADSPGGADDASAGDGGDTASPAPDGDTDDGSRPDTALGDTHDASRPDTTIGVGDAVAIDAPPPDTGPPCPAPTTMATFDPSGLSCAEITSTYQAKVAAARKCACNADCRVLVNRDFCGCKAVVNPANPAYGALDPLQNRYEKDGCSTFCTEALCPTITTGNCKSGLCVDVMSP